MSEGGLPRWMIYLRGELMSASPLSEGGSSFIIYVIIRQRLAKGKLVPNLIWGRMRSRVSAPGPSTFRDGVGGREQNPPLPNYTLMIKNTQILIRYDLQF